ncbi:MAG: hypothetical protein HRT47_01535 [Candidatus Caenarcaniphilales bacterium]|nr:hypothetical protein [Candidatus Caenarcaniphilales bacterium]
MFWNNQDVIEEIKSLKDTISGKASENQKLKDKIAELERTVASSDADKATALKDLERENEYKVKELEGRLERVKKEVELEYAEKMTTAQNEVNNANSQIIKLNNKIASIESKTLKEASEKLQQMSTDYDKLELQYKHNLKEKEQMINSLNVELENAKKLQRDTRSTTELTIKRLEEQLNESNVDRTKLLELLTDNNKAVMSQVETKPKTRVKK